MKKIVVIAAFLTFLFSSGEALAAPYFRQDVGIVPVTDSTYYLGTTTPDVKAWLGVIADQFCLTGDICISTWPSGSGGSGNVATSSAETATYIPFWTSTAGTPATLSGGESTFAYNSTLNKLTIENASTTNLTIGGLSSALLQVTSAGATEEYAGTTCTNEFIRALSALGVATCDPIDLAADVTGVLPAANGGLGADFSGATNGLMTWVNALSQPVITTSFSSLGSVLTGELAVGDGGTGVGTLTGLAKGNGTSAFTAGVDGTDFTLIDALTCTSGDFVSSVTAAGVFTCTTPSASGGITAIGPAGQTADGPTVTMATSSDTNIGLTITGSGDTLTFTSNWIGTLANARLTNSTVSYGGVTLSLGGTDATPAFDLTDATNLPITAGTTGTLGVARGGTGQTSFTSSQLLYGNGTNALSSVATTTLAGNSQVAVSNSPVVIGTSGAVLSIVADSIGDTQLAFNTGQNLTTASSPSFTGLTVGSGSGVLKVASGVVGVGADGTDYTLTNAITCTSGDFISAVTAAGVSTCTTPAAGGSPAGSGSELQARLNSTTFQALSGSSMVGSALTLNGQFNLSTTTYAGIIPIASIASSTGNYGDLWKLIATTTEPQSVAMPGTSFSTFFSNGVRIIIGAFDALRGYVGDQLNINGRINTGDWTEYDCNAPAGVVSQVASNQNSVCGDWGFAETTTGTLDPQTDSTVGGYLSLKSGTSAGNEGVLSVGAVSSGAFLKAATSTPVMEVVVRKTPGITSSNEVVIALDAGEGSQINEGCGFRSSDATANWFFTCENGAGVTTDINTGFATSTSSWLRFRMELDNNGARAYVQSTSTAMIKIGTVAVGTSYDPTDILQPTITANRSGSAGQAAIDILSIRTWVRRTLWPN